MDIAGAECFERFDMLGGSIAFVLVEAILRVKLVKLVHFMIAYDFGYNRGCCDTKAGTIAFNKSGMQVG